MPKSRSSGTTGSPKGTPRGLIDCDVASSNPTFANRRNFWEEGASHTGSYVDRTLSLTQAEMVARYGYLPAYLRDCVEQEEARIGQSCRGKIWAKVNTIHATSALKSTGVSSKSADTGAAEAGHVICRHGLDSNYFVRIDKERNRLNKQGNQNVLPSEVYPLPDSMRDANGNTQYVTYERQTLATIEARIASGYYTLKGSDGKDRIGIEDGVYYRIISDSLGRDFKLRYNPEKFKDITFSTGSPLTVTQRKLLREAKSVQDLKTTEKRTIRTVYTEVVRDKQTGKIIESQSKKTVYASYVGLDELIKRNPDSSIILEPLADPAPHVLCDALGNPLKGDVDLQDLFLPYNLPLIGMEYLYTKKAYEVFKDDPMFASEKPLKNINDLKDLMLKYRHELEKAKNPENRDEFSKIQRYIDMAVANIDKIYAERREIGKTKFQLDGAAILEEQQDEIILREIGVLNLTAAILIFAKQNGVLHGGDAASPIWPENYAVTHILDPDNHNRFLITHGEFEYVKELHNNLGILADKIKDFNPCHLVVDTDNKWRADLTDNVCPVDNVQHQYPNKTDEEDIVKLQRLLFERQFLMLRFQLSPAAYAAHLRTMERNHKIMVANIKLKDESAKKQLKAAWEAGWQQMQGIIMAVALQPDSAAIIARLDEIDSITNHSDNAKVKDNLAAIPLDYYTKIAAAMTDDRVSRKRSRGDLEPGSKRTFLDD